MLKDFFPFDLSTNALKIGHLFSVIGERLSFITLILIIREMYSHEVGPTLVLVLYTITFIIISPFIGGIIDFYSKKQILIITDVARSVLVLLYIPIMSLGKDYHLLMLLSIFTVVSISALARSTFWSYTPEVIEKSYIKTFNANISFNNNFGLAFGTALGGFLVSYMGHTIVFILDSLTYLISAMMIFFTRAKYAHVKKSIKKVKKGLNIKYIQSFIFNDSLRESLFVIAMVSFLIGVINSYIVINTESLLSLPKEYIGYSFASYALGSWFAPTLLKKLKIEKRIKRFLLEFLFLIILLSSFLFMAKTLYFYLILLFFLGLLTTACNAHYNAKAMISIDKNISGKFSSFLTILIRMMMFFGVMTIYYINTKSLYYLMFLLALITLGVIHIERRKKC